MIGALSLASPIRATGSAVLPAAGHAAAHPPPPAPAPPPPGIGVPIPAPPPMSCIGCAAAPVGVFFLMNGTPFAIHSASGVPLR